MITGNVLITGGLGFIGSTLARHLAKLGLRVTVLDNIHPHGGAQRFHVDGAAGVETVIGDVRDAEVLASAVTGKSVVFHLAALTSHVDSMRDPLADLDVNVAGMLTLLEACRSRNPDARIIFTSTRQVYGKAARLPVSEEQPIDPVDVNGIDKRSAESFLELYGRVYGTRYAILRLTNTYGPRMRIIDARQMFLGVWVRDALLGKSIQVFGDGSQRRDFTYVDDVVEALLLVAGADASRTYNLGGPDLLSLSELSTLLVAKTGGSVAHVPFPPDRKAIDIGDYHGDYRMIASELGWCPRISMTRGLEQTLDYFREHHARYL